MLRIKGKSFTVALLVLMPEYIRNPIHERKLILFRSLFVARATQFLFIITFIITKIVIRHCLKSVCNYPATIDGNTLSIIYLIDFYK